MGGVVLNGKIETVLNAIADKLNINNEEFSNLFRIHKNELQTGKMKIIELCELVKEKFNITEDIIPIWKDCYIQTMTFNNETIELINKLRKNYKIAVITNASDLHTEINKERNAFQYFDEVIASNEIGITKPDERIYRIMLDKLKVKSEECIFVDDREAQVLPATVLGMKGVLFSTVPKFIEDVTKLGVII